MATITLTAKDQVRPGTQTYVVDHVYLCYDPAKVIIQVTGEHGEKRGFQFDGAVGATVLNLINKGNFSANNLDDAILKQLVARRLLDGVVA